MLANMGILKEILVFKYFTYQLLTNLKIKIIHKSIKINAERLSLN